jgi:hypothetical protein
VKVRTALLIRSQVREGQRIGANQTEKISGKDRAGDALDAVYGAAIWCATLLGLIVGATFVFALLSGYGISSDTLGLVFWVLAKAGPVVIGIACVIAVVLAIRTLINKSVGF